MHAFAEHFDEKQPVVGTVCSTGVEDDVLPAAVEAIGQSDETELEGHEYNVQLLAKGGDSAMLPAMFESDDTTTESCQQRKFLGLSTVTDVQRNSSSLGKGQRRTLSSMTKVLSIVFAAAQYLDSSCTDCWNRAVRFGRPDLLEVCGNKDSPLVEAVESAGGEGLRTSFWTGYDLTTRRGRERLYLFCSRTRARHVWFSSPCRVSGVSSQRVSRILQGTADVCPRVQALGCHVHFAQPLSSASWNQRSLLDMTEKSLKAVVKVAHEVIATHKEVY